MMITSKQELRLQPIILAFTAYDNTDLITYETIMAGKIIRALTKVELTLLLIANHQLTRPIDFDLYNFERFIFNALTKEF